MTLLMTVDPGKHACAFSVWNGLFFLEAPFIEGPRQRFASYVQRWNPDVLVVEVPLHYPMGGKNTDPNDLVQVALSAGACIGTAQGVVVTVFPSQWKGQLPKEVHHRRVRSDRRYTERMAEEVAKVLSGLQHNVLDAIAMGLWATDGTQTWKGSVP